MGSTWHRLKYHGNTEIFLRFRLRDNNGYSAYLTDLATVWTESLSEPEVMKRAEDLESPVTQIGNILQTIQSSLEDEKLSEDALLINEGQHMKLSLSSSLSTLVRFRWDFNLSLDASLLREHIVWPLVCSAFLQKEKVAELYRIIRSKDQLLSKIKDNSSANGVDLSMLLPGAGSLGRRTAVRRDLPGLEPFHEESWADSWTQSLDKIPPFHLADAATVALRESSTLYIENMIARAEPTIQAPKASPQGVSTLPQLKLRGNESSKHLQHHENASQTRLSHRDHPQLAVDSDSTTADEAKPADFAETLKPQSMGKKLGGIGRLKRRARDGVTGKPVGEQGENKEQAASDPRRGQRGAAVEDTVQGGPSTKHTRLGKIGRQSRLAKQSNGSNPGGLDSSADRSDRESKNAGKGAGIENSDAAQKSGSKLSAEAVNSTPVASPGKSGSSADSKDHAAVQQSAEPILTPRKKKRRF